MLSLTDDPAEVVSAIKKNQPQPFENKNSVT
jgi:hypothetical protein